MSRPFLEHQVRQRVLALPNVTLRDNCAVKQLLASWTILMVLLLLLTPACMMSR